MLEKSVYLTKSPYAHLAPKEAEKAIADVLGIKIKNAADLLLVLNAYTLFMSHEELRALLPSSGYNNRINKLAVPQLKKAGYIDRIPLKTPIGTSKCLFEITKQGEGAANRTKGGAITVKRPKKFNKDTAQAYEDKLSHPYCAGFNLFQMLLLGEPFEWEREVPYGSAYEFKQNRSDFLQVDARCLVYPKNAKKGRTIFLEQDMGTETNKTLLEKLEKYDNFALMRDPKNMIVFSYYQKEAAIPTDHYQETVFANARCIALSDHMYAYNCESLEDVISTGYQDADYMKLLSSFVEEQNALFGEKEEISASFVSSFAKSLEAHENPYMLRSFNMAHLSLTKNRNAAIAKALMFAAYRPPRFFDRIAEGFVIAGVPTTLMANRLPFVMLSQFETQRALIEKTVSKYFPGAQFASEVSNPLQVSTGTSMSVLCMRNAFSYDTDSGKGQVYVEMPFMDVGSWLRVKLLRETCKETSPYSVICVLEDEEQASLFFSAIDYAHDDFDVPTQNEGLGGIYGIYLKDLGSEVFAPTGLGDFFTIY